MNSRDILPFYHHSSIIMFSCTCPPHCIPCSFNICMIVPQHYHVGTHFGLAMLPRAFKYKTKTCFFGEIIPFVAVATPSESKTDKVDNIAKCIQIFSFVF